LLQFITGVIISNIETIKYEDSNNQASKDSPDEKTDPGFSFLFRMVIYPGPFNGMGNQDVEQGYQ
jgi:hypothetical protein